MKKRRYTAARFFTELFQVTGFCCWSLAALTLIEQLAR